MAGDAKPHVPLSGLHGVLGQVLVGLLNVEQAVALNGHQGGKWRKILRRIFLAFGCTFFLS